MATTEVLINNQVLAQAVALEPSHSESETINTALLEFIQRRKSQELVNLFGTIEYASDYNYKKLRAR